MKENSIFQHHVNSFSEIQMSISGLYSKSTGHLFSLDLSNDGRLLLWFSDCKDQFWQVSDILDFKLRVNNELLNLREPDRPVEDVAFVFATRNQNNFIELNLYNGQPIVTSTNEGKKLAKSIEDMLCWIEAIFEFVRDQNASTEKFRQQSVISISEHLNPFLTDMRRHLINFGVTKKHGLFHIFDPAQGENAFYTVKKGKIFSSHLEPILSSDHPEYFHQSQDVPLVELGDTTKKGIIFLKSLSEPRKVKKFFDNFKADPEVKIQTIVGCPYCNGPMYENSSFCIYCGGKIDKSYDVRRYEVSCFKCGLIFNEDIKSCTGCGAAPRLNKALLIKCLHCAATISETATYCVSCGNQDPFGGNKKTPIGPDKILKYFIIGVLGFWLLSIAGGILSLLLFGFLSVNFPDTLDYWYHD